MALETAPGVTAPGQVRLEGEGASPRAQEAERGSRRGFTGQQTDVQGARLVAFQPGSEAGWKEGGAPQTGVKVDLDKAELSCQDSFPQLQSS